MSTDLQVLYAAGDTGGVATERITIGPSDDGSLSVDISQDEVGGVGDMTQAASWNAVAVATLLSGAPLDIAYRFAFDGRIDGPSAGALTTVGLLSLFYGDPIRVDATMTGTINPTGTVGTVGGIPEKIQGVIDAGTITTVLIPSGQRNTPDASGALVDVVRLGADNGVEVIEVANVYDAYTQLTGADLPRPESGAGPVVADGGYTKFRSAADQMLAGYDRAAAEFAALDPTVREAAAEVVDQADASAARARDLQVQALQGGAFFEASQAMLLMQATSSTFRTLQDLIITGGAAIEARLAAAASSESEFTAFLDQLSTFQPETLGDVEALVSAYGNAFDSYTLLLYATSSLQTIADTTAAGGYTAVDQLLTDVVMPLLFYDMARSNLQFAKSLFDIGRDNGGSPVAADADLEAIGSFYRRAADADWAAFESVVIQSAAEARGESNDVFRGALAAADFDVALAYTAQQALPEIESYLGEGSNAPYAAMGYGYVNYARNAVLIEKYYNNGILDENLALVGVASETVLTEALDLGRAQTERAATVLSDNGTDPVIVAGAYEQAGVAREGDVADKFQAISQYAAAFGLARILAYTGGFPRAGYEAAP